MLVMNIDCWLELLVVKWLNSRLSRIVMIVVELMLEWKMVLN